MTNIVDKKSVITVSDVAVAGNVALGTLTSIDYSNWVSASAGCTSAYYNSSSTVTDDKPKEIKEEPRKESLEEIISYFGVR